MSEIAPAEVIAGKRTAKVTSRFGDWGMILAIGAVLQAIGLAAQNLSPVLVAPLSQGRGLSEGMAGVVQTVELAVVAFAAYHLTWLAAKMSARRLALIGTTIAAVCHILSTFATPLPLLLVLRAVAGLGEAMCVCAANAVMSAQAEPDKIYGRSYAIISLAGIGLYPLLVYVGAQTNGWGVYAGEGVWFLLLLPIVALLPPLSQPVSADAAPKVVIKLPLLNLLPTVPIALVTIFSIGLWAFAGTVAQTAKVSSDVFGWTLAIGTALSAVSAWVSSLLGTRFGRLRPLIIGLAVTVIGSVAFFTAKDAMVYAISFVLVQIVYSFILPYMFGFCSALDKTGRLATTASSVMLIASAAAPALIGWVIQVAGMPALVVALVIGYGLAGMTIYISTVLLKEDA